MEKTILFPMILDLQLFAEGTGGGDGGTGSEGATGVSATAAVSQTKGAKSNPLANVVYGKQEEVVAETPVAEVVSTEDRNAKFEELIKGEYKDLYDQRMQETIQKRLKGTKETVDKYNELTPTLEMLAKKYGVDPSDIKALNKAIEEDDAYYEEEALEKGISVEQLKEIKRMERENADLKRQMSEQARKENAAQQYAAWMEQAKQAKLTYPSLDLNTEAKNPEFLKLLNSGVDVGTAYAVIHKDEIIPAAMQYTAKTVEQKLTNKVIANGARPSENGISSQSATLTKRDVSSLTKEDFAEIERRVARGERISFG
jgi:LysM repeat protein